MPKQRKTRTLAPLVGLLVAVSFNAAVADTALPAIPGSPDEVRPIEVGTTIPDVTLATLDHESVALRELLAQQPTILIYYRGGW